jgi:hypothetical protein
MQHLLPIPVIILSFVLLGKHHVSHIDPLIHQYTRFIIALPLVETISFCGMVFFNRPEFLLLATLYESIVLLCLLLLVQHLFREKAAFYYKIHVNFPHREKCSIDERFKLEKLVSFYSLTDPILPLEWINRGVYQFLLLNLIFIVPRLFLSFLLFSFFTQLSYLVAIMSIFIFIRPIREILWVHDPVLKWCLVCLPSPLLFFQLLLFYKTIDILLIVVNTEMFFILLYYIWTFPLDESTAMGIVSF